MDAFAYSVNGIPIRLSHERWYHVVESHDDLASHFDEVLDTIESPDLVLRGSSGALKAARNVGRGKWLVVIYRELSKQNGFVITAYFLETRPKGEAVWQR